mgnify:CR=1 FL=1
MTPDTTHTAGRRTSLGTGPRHRAGRNDDGRREPFQWFAALLLTANAAIHGYLAPMHLAEAPYLGWGFIALAAASLAIAVGLAAADRPWLWATALTVTTAALVGLLASRTVGLPEIHDEIGNWTDTLAIATLVIEVAIVMFAATRIIWWRTDRRHERTGN